MTKNLPMVRIIPKEQLELNKKQIKDVVKATDTNELHSVFRGMLQFVNTFSSVVNDEIKSRLKKSRKKGITTVYTDEGKITFAIRNNYEFAENKIVSFLKKKKIPKEHLYDSTYLVVTKNQKVIASLLSKGYITKIDKIDVKAFETLAERHPQLLKFVKNNPTEYLTGLK